MLKNLQQLNSTPVTRTFITPVQNWVKNVYSMCVQGRVTRVRSYTAIHQVIQTAVQNSVQQPTFTHFMPSFTPALYTPMFSVFNPLIVHFYTVSTPPIITKKN